MSFLTLTDFTNWVKLSLSRWNLHGSYILHLQYEMRLVPSIRWWHFPVSFCRFLLLSMVYSRLGLTSVNDNSINVMSLKRAVCTEPFITRPLITLVQWPPVSGCSVKTSLCPNSTWFLIKHMHVPHVTQTVHVTVIIYPYQGSHK